MKSLNFILVLSVLLFVGCKDSDRDKDSSVNSCESYGAGQSYAYDVFKMVHQAALSSKGITTGNLADTTSLFGCDTLIVDTNTNPMTITIQFNGACLYNDIERSGEITASFSSKYDNLASNVSISFNNYYYNGLPVTGTMSYNFNGITNGNPTYGVSTSDFTMTDSKNRVLQFSGTQTLTITAGETTATFNDDNYSITGVANGLTYQGNDYSASINDVLTLKGNCEWVNSGTVTVSPENKQPRNLDFGSSCDNKGTAQIYGLSYEVVFP